MKEAFQRITTSIIISSIIAFIIGLVMTIVPNISLQIIGIVIGIFVIVYGIALIALEFTSRSTYVPFYGMISGVLSIIIGILFIAMPGILPTIFAIALGIWIILSSIDTIRIAIAARKEVSNWFLWLILGIIDLICGVIILFNPFASSISIVMLGGIIIMIHSVISIVNTIMIKKDAKRVVKALEAGYKPAK